MSSLVGGTHLEVAPKCASNPALQALYAHWLDRRGARLMPARSDLILSQIKAHLPWMAIIEVEPGAREFRYRLVGTRVAMYFSADATGLTVSDAFAFNAQAGEIMHALLRQVVETKQPLRTYGDLSWMGRDLEDFESLFLPLSNDDATVNGIMNPFVFDHSRVYLNRQLGPELS